jgi:hypothetical protein
MIISGTTISGIFSDDGSINNVWWTVGDYLIAQNGILYECVTEGFGFPNWSNPLPDTSSLVLPPHETEIRLATWREPFAVYASADDIELLRNDPTLLTTDLRFVRIGALTNWLFREGGPLQWLLPTGKFKTWLDDISNIDHDSK